MNLFNKFIKSIVVPDEMTILIKRLNMALGTNYRHFIAGTTIPVESNHPEAESISLGEDIEKLRGWVQAHIPKTIWLDTNNQKILYEKPPGNYKYSTTEVQTASILTHLLGRDLVRYLC